MYFTLSGTFIVVKFMQPEKAMLSILVTLSGIVIDVRLVQLSKALSPILVISYRLMPFICEKWLVNNHLDFIKVLGAHFWPVLT